MLLKKLRNWAWIALITTLANAISVRAECKPGYPTGYFEGTVISKQAGKLEVSLNLRCADGSYEGDLVTPVGTYSVEGGSFDAGNLRLQLGAGGDRVSVELQVDAGVLHGTFVARDDTGLIEVRRTGEWRPPGSSTPTLDLSKEQWHEDLKFYLGELPKRHINAFHHISRDQFASEGAAFDHRIEQLDGDAVFAGLVRLAALVGDGHTHFEPPEDTANFPIDVRRFGDDYRVVAVGVATNDNRVLGARIVKIEGTPIARPRALAVAHTPGRESQLGACPH